MDQDLFGFVTNTTRENYLQSRQLIVRDPAYDPYSNDLKELEQLLGEDKYEEVIAFSTLNTQLSARAHLMKRIALIETGDDRAGDMELIIAQKILECVDLTGDGSLEKPYIVTRVADESDYLSYIGEEMASQALIQPPGRFVDVITTASGKSLHFDITDCYLRMIVRANERQAAQAPAAPKKVIPEVMEEEEDAYPEPKKKWWKFW